MDNEKHGGRDDGYEDDDILSFIDLLENANKLKGNPIINYSYSYNNVVEIVYSLN